MSEQVSHTHEIYVAPPLTPVERLKDALNAGDYAAAAVANTYYIDTVLPEAQLNNRARKVYTEVHAVGDGFVIAPSVDNGDVHRAHATGVHSMFDIKRHPTDVTSARKLEADLGSTLHLGVESMVGKGTIELTPDGAYRLEIRKLLDDGSNEFNWVQRFSRRLSDYPSMKFAYTPYRTEIKQSLSGELPLRGTFDIHADQVKPTKEDPDSRAGIVTAVDDIILPRIKRSRDTELYQSARLILHAVEGNSRYHGAIYDAAKLISPKVFTISPEGLEEQRLAIHYVIDSFNTLGRALITYNNKPGEFPQETIRNLVKAAVGNYLRSNLPSGAPTYVNESFDQGDLSNLDTKKAE